MAHFSMSLKIATFVGHIGTGGPSINRIGDFRRFEVLQNSLLKSTLHAKVSSPSGLLTLNNLGNYAVGMQIRSGNVLCLV